MKDAVRHVLREGPAVEALGAGAPVPSPCTNVCRIDPQAQLCEGCLRTIDEVVAWGSLDGEGRRAVWRRLGERARALTPTLSQGEREQDSPAPRP